ncbi:hypothetical protein JII91_29640 (plasmid) [Klebsiella quasipneumoniae]|uniref:hypothetical protein n=1 Tax=Klebsiella quasipneumoniae TaxID=1463165 RepID=UPI001916B419|nr:hypothetical protein [Klebsiella quasipneumoniae]QQM83422.1 hypothetical protein JII91_29640 [Klebsiella quasipneumoniae]
MSSFATNTLFAAFAIVVLHSEAQAASAEQCGSGSTQSGQTLKVNGSEVVLHSAPNAKVRN